MIADHRYQDFIETESTLPNLDPIALFGMYMQVTGIPSLDPPIVGDPRLRGKKLGILNGSAWITLWSNYFGRVFLPEVQLINVGNEAIQLNFMRAHRLGLPCPPEENIRLFAQYARELVELVGVDVILISCSTMNRSHPYVEAELEGHGVPVVPIDMPMMERAIECGERILVVATHGPTVKSTELLLKETAARMGKDISATGVTVEEAFELLGKGRVREHNEVIASAIRRSLACERVDVVVLAQLSMTIFKLSYPEPEEEFGIPVLTSGEEGFRRVREILLDQSIQRRKSQKETRDE